MKKAIAAIILLSLSSLLSAKPTIALIGEDNEGEPRIRPKEAIALSANETYWWFGKFDLFQAICRYTNPPGLPAGSEPDTWALRPLLPDPDDSCSRSNVAYLTPRWYIPELVVLKPEDDRQFAVDPLWIETTIFASRNTPSQLAQNDLISRR